MSGSSCHTACDYMAWDEIKFARRAHCSCFSKGACFGALGADLLNRHVLAGPKASRAYLAMRQGWGKMLQSKARESAETSETRRKHRASRQCDSSALTFPGTSLGRLSSILSLGASGSCTTRDDSTWLDHRRRMCGHRAQQRSHDSPIQLYLLCSLEHFGS